MTRRTFLRKGAASARPTQSETQKACLVQGQEEWCPEHIVTDFVAEYCGVSKTTVERWIVRGYLRATKVRGGHYQISREAFVNFLAEHSAPT